MRRKSKPAAQSPLRAALRPESRLLDEVRDGLGAIKSADRSCLHVEIRSAFADRLEADEALRAGHDQENRWDYLLGHSATSALVGVEPHSAKEDQVSVVIKKRSAAIRQLAEHLREGVAVARWLWVSSGDVYFADTERTRRRLDNAGIEFVGRRVLARHLEGLRPSGASMESLRKRNDSKGRR